MTSNVRVDGIVDRAHDGPNRWADPVLPMGLCRSMGPPDPHARERPANVQLIEACCTNDLHAAREALDQGADPNVRTANDNVPLLLAIKTPTDRPVWDPRLVRMLLEAGADPGHVDHQGYTVALRAWMYSHNAPGAMAVTAWMVQHPLTDVTRASGMGSTMIATAHYAPHLVPTLVRRGEDPNRFKHTPSSIWPPTTSLGMALRTGVVGVASALVRAFVAAGADLDASPPDGEPALVFVLSHSRPLNLDSLNALLDAGASPWWCSSTGETLDDRIAAQLKRHHPDTGPLDTFVERLTDVREQLRLRKAWQAMEWPTEVRPRRRL